MYIKHKIVNMGIAGQQQAAVSSLRRCTLIFNSAYSVVTFSKYNDPSFGPGVKWNA
jgi:hypothetical protein